MENKLHVSLSPHIHSNNSTQKTMLDVIIALVPASIAAVILFGIPALIVIAVCVVSAVAGEALFNLAVKKEQTIGDLSAVVTGLILALNLPANVPLWQAAVGSLFAIIIVKGIFGGLGKNIVNPAIAARVFMLIAFGSMTAAVFPEGMDSASGATPLSDLANDQTVNLVDLFLGKCGGALGETCALALLIGGIYLIVRKVITWQIPVAFIGTTFLFTLAVEGGNVETTLAWVLSGGLMIGAFFMATDYVTSPSTAKGKLIFGIGAGVITVLIRFWGGYPEGVSFAILLMNIVNPYIDSFTQRKLFGGKK
ncbi:MAG: RnfABCDGE type electron transport complex subunit D [Clostridia bacterium]|nr:RnfABCDGE type electron transport complex subunit D [Clostridia bacterium]MBR5545036.1 RnfABCDGE type electron transport complex subunit D [Clostridia bacterium]